MYLGLICFEGNQADCQSTEDIEKFYDFTSNTSQLMRKHEIMPNCETKIWKMTADWADADVLKTPNTSQLYIEIASNENKVTF